MTRKVLRIGHRVKVRIRQLRRRTHSARVATRCQIILLPCHWAPKTGQR